MKFYLVMRKISYLFLLTAVFIKSFEAKLMEPCPSPWKEYRISGTGLLDRNSCRDKCWGQAFRTDQGQLICFNTKDDATPVPTRYVGNYDKRMCHCGFSVQKSKFIDRDKALRIAHHDGYNWYQCEPVRRTEYHNNRRSCKIECSQLALFSYSRGKKKQLLHCEPKGRSQFYNIVGESELEPLMSDSKSRYRYRECKCGLDNYQFSDESNPRLTIENGIFEECGAPWVTRKIKVTTIETCSEYCTKHCLKGKGLEYQNARYCFHREVATKGRPSKSVEYNASMCECGYVKQSHGATRHEFVSCQPEILSNASNRRICSKICQRSRALITILRGTNMTVRCVEKPDLSLFSWQHLSGKCDRDIYRDETNEKYRYMICRCGLRIPFDEDFTDNATIKPGLLSRDDIENLQNQVSPSWGVTKKRSSLAHRRKILAVKNE